MSRTDHFIDATFTGNLSFGADARELYKNVVYAQQFAGADVGKRIEAACATLTNGGIVDATAFKGSYSVGADVTIDENNVTILLGSVTLTHSAGINWTITGTDVEILGIGDSTVLDFSAETGNNIDSFEVTGARAHLSNFKIIGSRVVGGGTSQAIDLNACADSRVSYMRIQDAGKSGIRLQGAATDCIIENNIVTGSDLSGIRVESATTARTIIRNNHVDTSNVSDTTGHGGIAVAGNATDTLVIGNHVTNTTQTGIRANASVRTRIIGNLVSTTSGASSSEGITCGDNCLILGNTLDTIGASGILVSGTATVDDSVVSSNCIKNVGQAGNQVGIRLNAEAGNIKNVVVIGNSVHDDQSTATTTRAVRVTDSVGGGSFTDIFIIGNSQSGVLNADSVAVDAGFVGNVTLFGNPGINEKTDENIVIGGDLDHDGTNVGFYGTAPVAQQTGVAVSAAAIHAALVNLGLITA